MDKFLDKFMDVVYNTFFLRDILSIFSSGIIFYFSISGVFLKITCFNDVLQQVEGIKADSVLKYFYYILSISIIYALGLIINYLRDSIFIYWHYSQKSDGEWYNFIKRHTAGCKRFYAIKASVTKDADKPEKKYYQSRSDRLVIIFQTIGNLGLAIIIAGICQLLYQGWFEGAILVVIGSISMLISSRIFIHHKLLNEEFNKK